MNDLNDKQQAFIAEYLQCFNATEAAKRAGYSEKTAYSIGWENLRKPEIAEVIKQHLESRVMMAEEVLMRLAEQARADLTQYITNSGELDVEALREDGKGHLLKKYHRTKRTIYRKNGDDEEIDNITAELYDAQSALKLLGDNQKMFTQRVEHTGKDGESIQIAIVNVDTDAL